ncbi:Gamma-tubulin complex component 6 [Nymphon striatum]|nr:Gamma-tubulin complex component 6 [Nymphon striatum]
MDSSESVNTLVNRLCKHHLEPNSSSVSTNALHLLKLKSLAYNILLHKPIKTDILPLSVIEKLSAHVFNLRNRGYYVKAARLDKLICDVAENIENKNVIFDMPAILTFLVKLADTGSKQENRLIGQSVWSQISDNTQQGEHIIYPNCPPIYGTESAKNGNFFMHFPCSVFENVDVVDKPIESKSSFSSDIFEAKPGLDVQGNQLLCSNISDKSSSYAEKTKNTLFSGLHHGRSNTKDLNMKLDIPELNDIVETQFNFKQLPRRTYKLSQGSEAISEDEGFLDQDNCTSLNQASIWENVMNVKPNTFYTWETIGRYDLKKEKPFLSEAGPKVVAKLHSLITRNLRIMNPSLNFQLPEPVLIDQTDLVTDLVNLMVGIPSENFSKLGENFVQRPGLHIEGLTPDSITSLISPLLVTAKNYIRLSSMSTNLTALHHQGFVFQAFKKGISQYLSCYYAAVLMLNRNVSIMELCISTERLRNQIKFLTTLCRLGEEGHNLPNGVDLLTYIYKTSVDNWHSEYYALLLFLLRVTCKPYFRFLQDWLFEGKCEDLFGEYMIQADEVLLSSRDRSYWTNGYVLLQTSGGNSNFPTFLQNLGSNIFLCGKSLNLLKLCNPKHSLCRIDRNLTPSFAMTFSANALKQLHQKCSSYSARITYLTQQTNSTREQHLLMEEQDKLQRAALAKQQAEETIAKITKNAMQSKKDEYQKKKLQYEILRSQMAKNLAQRQKSKEEEAHKDAKMAELAEKEHQKILIQQKRELEAKQQKILQDIEDKTKIRNTSEEVRMSITEDDDGTPRINLNLIPSNNADIIPSPEDVSIVSSTLTQNVNEFLSNTDNIHSNSKLSTKINPDGKENLNDLINVTNVINDSINSNVLFNPEPIICENFNSKFQIEDKKDLFEQYKTLKSVESSLAKKQEGLFCDSSVTFSKAKVRSHFGHSSDSNIQTLLYDSNKNSKFPLEKSSNEVMNQKNGAAKHTSIELDSEKSEIKTIIKQNSAIHNHNIKDLSKCVGKKEMTIVVDGKKDTESLDIQSNVGQVHVDSSTRDDVDSKLLSHAVNNVIKFDSSPDFSLMNVGGSISENVNEDDKDIESSLNMPLSVLIHRSLIKPVSLQVNLINKSIVDYFMVDLQINEHFHALRNFLFLHDGEFGHMLSEQLFEAVSNCSTPAQVLNPMTLNNLLSRSLSSSLHGDSIYADNLSFMMKPFYTTLQPNALLHNLDCCPQFRQLQMFRHEMQHFSRVLQSYVVSQVLQITWQEFQENLQTQVHTIDELRHAHSLYLNKACFRCLQNEKATQVVKIVHDIFSLILKFQAQLVSYPWKINPKTTFPEHSKFQSISKVYKNFHEYSEFLCKVLRMLASRGYQPHLQEFLLRLDFNNFYQKQKIP